jgi:TorA maturation chaperone TorD
MMQDAYDEVREFYSLFGVEIGNADVMPDHIGAELNFLAILFDRMASETGIKNQYKGLAETFLMFHLRNWVPRFTADMEEASKTNFYKTLAKKTREAVA